jgi:hypothetical protein
MKAIENVSKAMLVALCIGLGACASSKEDIPTQYVSPLQYSSYKCSQIEMEMQMVSRRVSELAGEVDKRASNDSAKMGVGLILLWPTLFFLDGDGPQAVEYGRLKGEFEALEKAAIQKNCKIKIERYRAQTEPPAKPKEEEDQYEIKKSR